MDIRSASSYRTLAVLLVAMAAFCAILSVWTEHSDAAVVQEAKNCLADLKWAEAAIKAYVKK